MSRSSWAWTKAIFMVFAATALVVGLYAAPARAESGSGAYSTPSTTDPKTRSIDVSHPGAEVLGPWTGYSSAADAARVRALQVRLADAGYAPGPIDGLYGPLTEQAVMRFQAEHGLQVDGIAGPLTLAAIGRAPTILYPGTGYAGKGSSFVRRLQRRLASAGYAPGPIDGRYGPLTEHAVMRFQARHGLQIDGIAGPLTLGLIGTHMPNTAGRVVLPAPSHQAPSRPSGSHHARPHVAHRQPAPATLPTTAPSHSTSSSPVGLIALLIGIAAALVLATMALIGWRRERRPAIANASSNGASRNGRAQAVNGHHGPATAVRDPGNEVTAASPGEARIPDEARTPGDALTAGEATTRAEAHIPDEAHTPAGAHIPDEAHTPNGARTPAEAHTQAGAHTHAEGHTPTDEPTLEEARTPEEAPITTAARRPNEEGESNQTQEPDDKRVAEEADRMFRHALALEEAGEITEAVAAYRRADELGHATAPSNLGVLLEQHGDHAGAEACYRRADERGDPDGAFNLALLLGEQGDHMGALEAYERADQLGHGTAAANLGVLLGEQGDLAVAEACFRRADERGDAHGAFNLAVLLDQHGDHVGALEAYRRAAQRGNEAIAERACAAARDLTSKIAAGKVADHQEGQQ